MAYEGTIHSRELTLSDDGFPVKLYNFRSAFDSGAFESTVSTKQHLLRILNEKLLEDSKKYAFGIAASWGRQERRGAPFFDNVPVRCIDLFRYTRESSWDINPEIEVLDFNEGDLCGNSTTTCETTAIVLGEEGKLRRKTSNLEDYLISWPNLQPLGP